MYEKNINTAILQLNRWLSSNWLLLHFEKIILCNF
jgi:hypothetical protein